MAARTLIARISPLVDTTARSPSLLRNRALAAAVGNLALRRSQIASAKSGGLLRSFSTSSPSNVSTDSSTSSRKVAPTDGCDHEHYFVVMDAPDSSLTRDQIIDSYVKTLAKVLGSKKEARKAIYSVSTKYYYAFGCNVHESLAYKIKKLPKVRWVMADSYLDEEKKDYGGEPFINGQAVPYDPKYHAHWVENLPSKEEQNNSEQLKNLEGQSESKDEETNNSDDDIETDTSEAEETDTSVEVDEVADNSKADSSKEDEATITDSSDEDEEIDMKIIDHTKNLDVETENTESRNEELQKESFDDIAVDLSRNMGEMNTSDIAVDLSKNLGEQKETTDSITIDLSRDIETQDGMTVQITIPPHSPRKVTIRI